MAMHDRDTAERLAGTASVLAMAVAALVAVLASGPASAGTGKPAARTVPVNVTTGAPLQPGVYGRIDVSRSALPPVIYPKPTRVRLGPPAPGQDPVYLYVPPGQVRKWPQHCEKWKACDLPVYFVRVDNSPSKLGKWAETARPQSPISIVQAFAPRTAE